MVRKQFGWWRDKQISMVNGFNFQFKKAIYKLDFTLLFVIILSFLPLWSFVRPGIFSGHDTESHIARLVVFYKSLSEGNIIPRWAGDLNMGYGHPILMFLYPLSNYIGSFWHFLGFSFIDSVKITFGSAYIFSGLFMYLFGKEIVGKNGGLLMAVLYLFAPYRFVDLYVRAALGEHLAFTFMPLVLYAYTLLIKSGSDKFLLLSSLSLSLLILSHNAISLIFIPFFIFYLSIYYYFHRSGNKNIYKLIGSVLLGFLLAAFFWLPAFIEGKYTLRDILTKDAYLSHFPIPAKLLFSVKSIGGFDDMPLEIGLTNWLLVISGLYFLIKTKKRGLNYFLVMLLELFFFATLFLLSRLSLVLWKNITIIQKFQFPWRFLSMSVLTTSLLVMQFYMQNKKMSKKLVVFLSIVPILFSFYYWRPSVYLTKTDDFYINNYQGTTDTGESSPLWSIRGMEQKPKSTIELIGGKGLINEVKRTTNTHIYKISAKTNIQLLDNTVYFPGWVAKVDGKNVPIEYQDLNHIGLITFNVPKGDHEVKLEFLDTKVRKVSNALSVIGFLIVFAILVRQAVLKVEKLRKASEFNV